MPQAYIYLRVSGDGQAASGLGLEAQETEAMRTYEQVVRPLGYGTPVVFADKAVSASDFDFDERPKARELLLLLSRGDCLIFPKMDRGFRNLTDMLVQLRRWGAQGVRVFSPEFGGIPYDSESPVGRIVAVFTGLAAEWEGRRNRERAAARVGRQRETGRPTNGTAPFGFRVVRDHEKKAWLHPDDEERFWMRYAVAGVAAGYSQRDLLAVMAASGCRNRARKPIASLRNLQKMLETERVLRGLEEKAGIDWRSERFVTPEGVLLARRWKLPAKFEMPITAAPSAVSC